MEKKHQQPIPIEGSLGLLALGADGLRAWRSAREKQAEVQTKKKESDG